MVMVVAGPSSHRVRYICFTSVHTIIMIVITYLRYTFMSERVAITKQIEDLYEASSWTHSIYLPKASSLYYYTSVAMASAKKKAGRKHVKGL